MPDCPGAGNGDWRDYEHRSLEEQRDDRIVEARKWIERKRFKVVRVGTPEDGEYFVNFKIENGCSFYHFISDDRKILKAEYTPLYGTDKMVANFDEKYRYYIVKKITKSNKRVNLTP